MTAQVIYLQDRFTARRCLDRIDAKGVAIRAKNAAHAQGASRWAQQCADLAVAKFQMGMSAHDAIDAARAHAQGLVRTNGGGNAA